MIDPQRPSFNNLPPPVMIESMSRDGKSVPMQNGLRLPPNLHTLQFDYTALSFVAPQKVRFRYRLEGHDTNWQDAGTRREALYNDLPPGSYLFHVIGSNNDGVWNDQGASFGFVVTPAIYQRTPFKVALAALACVFLWGLYLMRVANLTEKVRARLTERINERERIARELHDTLLQSVQGLTLLFDRVMAQMPVHDPNREMLGRALDRADEVLVEGRNRVGDLRFERETPQSLADAIKEAATEILRESSISFRLEAVGSMRLLNSALREEAYRIGREALLNASRHAGASQVEVTLVYERTCFRMIIHDNGSGIPTDVLEGGRSGHYGLSGMRERAHHIGGELCIGNRNGNGTEVRLSLPAKLAYIDVISRRRWHVS